MRNTHQQDDVALSWRLPRLANWYGDGDLVRGHPLHSSTSSDQSGAEEKFRPPSAVAGAATRMPPPLLMMPGRPVPSLCAHVAELEVTESKAESPSPRPLDPLCRSFSRLFALRDQQLIERVADGSEVQGPA